MTAAAIVGVGACALGMLDWRATPPAAAYTAVADWLNVEGVAPGPSPLESSA